MPVYGYQCLDCNERFEVFLRYEAYGKKEIDCPECGSKQIKRLINRVRVSHSTETRYESLSDPAMVDRLEDDPKAMGRMMREMSKETGEDLGPEFNDVVDRLEAGQSPQEIEKSLPDMEPPQSPNSEFGHGLPSDDD